MDSPLSFHSSSSRSTSCSSNSGYNSPPNFYTCLTEESCQEEKDLISTSSNEEAINLLEIKEPNENKGTNRSSGNNLLKILNYL